MNDYTVKIGTKAGAQLEAYIQSSHETSQDFAAALADRMSMACDGATLQLKTIVVPFANVDWIIVEEIR